MDNSTLPGLRDSAARDWEGWMSGDILWSGAGRASSCFTPHSQSCIPAWQCPPVPSTAEAMSTPAPGAPVELLGGQMAGSPTWGKGSQGPRGNESTCVGPVPSCNSYQLGTAGTHGLVATCMIFYAFCLSFF